MIRRAVGVCWLAAVTAACGHAIFTPPKGPGASTDASAAWAQATAACGTAETYSAALRLSGRSGGQRIPTLSVETATTPTQVYLSAMYSGRPVFVLAGAAAQATLWLRLDDSRVVKGPASEIVDAILGLSIPPDRLLALFTGCVTRTLSISSATQRGEFLAVQTPDALLYLQQQNAGWRVRAGDVEGFRVEYEWKAGTLPDRIWIHTTPGREPAASLNVTVSDASVTDPIPASVFSAPAGAANATPMTLEELRSTGPWRKK